MLRRLSLSWLVFLLPFIGSGCMACLNMRDGPDPKFHTDSVLPPRAVYGGVRLDAIVFADGVYDVCADPSLRLGERLLVPPYLVLLLADLPLSAVADTITLPITIRATLNRHPEPDTRADSDGESFLDATPPDRWRPYGDAGSGEH